MDDINYDELIKIVQKSLKKSYETYEYNGKPIPNLANIGGKKDDVAKRERSGEYSGIAVKLLENLRPILTGNFVIRLLTILKKEDYITPLELLKLTTLDQLQYILHKWFVKATLEYNNQLAGSKKNYPFYDEWINSVTHDPLLCRIKIVEIGSNQTTGDSVVPTDWVDREFKDGYDLHKEMNKLESRLGKPPVTYAITYSMTIQKNDTIVKNINNIQFQKIFYLDFIDSLFTTEISKKIKKKYHFVQYGQILVGFKLDSILEPKKSVSKNKEVGMLVSRLQKAIRRGRYGSKALLKTINALNESPNYNLPEHNFMRVSASKQLVWRLFISILEDCRPYQAIDEPSLLVLILLVMITQKLQEYKFTKPVLDTLKLLALVAQYNDKQEDLYLWRKLPIANSTPLIDESENTATYHNALSLALTHMTMMSGDNSMLRRLYSADILFEPFDRPASLKSKLWKKTLASKKYIYHDSDVYDDIILSSFDMHSKPHIILYYQACIPISLTTKEISGYIWDVSSKYNIRSPGKKPKTDKILRSIQKFFLEEPINKNIKSNISKQTMSIYKKIKPDNNIKRTSFLVAFGTKYRYGGKDVILAGTSLTPARVKIENEWTYYSDNQLIDGYPEKTIILSDIDPPFGYKWKKNKIVTKIIKGKPIVDNKEIPFFDGSDLIQSITPKVDKNVGKEIYRLIIQIFSGLDLDFQTLLKLRKTGAKELLNWKPKLSDIKKLNMELLVLIYTKLFNQLNNLIMVGPVARSGNKMQNSINYLLEGKLWAIFNLFTFMYPDTFKTNGSLNFKVKKDTAGYVHLVRTLESILFVDKPIKGPIPSIKTELWDHQKDSVNRIMGGFKQGHHGFGDASDVGSGKTLTALSIACNLIKETNQIYSGILVLLPNNNLIKTWKDELTKHTKDFNIIFQQNKAKIGPINQNTIVITTMGRNRDHPINHKWLLVVIDECLTVQNKNALWTESAWKQGMMANYLLMLSATFFRTRFDKLYYMLKMLKTGLSEKREYLETILLESIISQISGIKRKWKSNFNYFELDTITKKEYEKINQSDLSTDAKFAKLASFLTSNNGVTNLVLDQLLKLIKKLEKNNKKCLIYAKSDKEAIRWSEKLNIPIYPTKGNHCIITYSKGTYGLNDLVIYDTIVMRPPQPDMLPQIRGRLDRPGQLKNNLCIEYFILKNTIENGLILRLEIASQFVHKYIMPLSKFYDISINHKKYSVKTAQNN